MAVTTEDTYDLTDDCLSSCMWTFFLLRRRDMPGTPEQTDPENFFVEMDELFRARNQEYWTVYSFRVQNYYPLRKFLPMSSYKKNSLNNF